MYFHLQECCLEVHWFIQPQTSTQISWPCRWDHSVIHIEALLSLCPWQGWWAGTGKGWLLTDALESGNCPLSDVCVLVMQALSQAGCTGFTLETRVTNIPLPGVLIVTLDLDACVFNRCWSRACGACKSTDKRGEMNKFQLVRKSSRSLASGTSHPAQLETEELPMKTSLPHPPLPILPNLNLSQRCPSLSFSSASPTPNLCVLLPKQTAIASRQPASSL